MVCQPGGEDGPASAFTEAVAIVFRRIFRGLLWPLARYPASDGVYASSVICYSSVRGIVTR